MSGSCNMVVGRLGKKWAAPSENSILPILPEMARLFDLFFGEIVVEWTSMKREQEPQNHIDPELKALASQPLTHDRLFREVFAWTELAEAFLRFVLPKKVLEKLDLDGLPVEPKDFLSVIFRETRADMVYRVPILGSEQTLCVYVLLEHKSYDDQLAIFQADQYAGQIGQNEVRRAQDEKRLNHDFKLSPVLVILFHHGESAFTGPSDVAGVYEDYGF